MKLSSRHFIATEFYEEIIDITLIKRKAKRFVFLKELQKAVNSEFIRTVNKWR